jgi:hypothetical protein
MRIEDGLPNIQYEEMRKYFPIYEEAVSYMTLQLTILNFLIYEENLIFFFISASTHRLFSLLFKFQILFWMF